MGLQTLQVIITFLLLAIALCLFAYTLPRRDWFAVRAVCCVAAIVSAAALMAQAGFSLYPAVTDDLSFVRGSCSFLVLLALMMASQLVLWECSPLTALYCCSSAYLLQNLSESLSRVLHLAHLVPLADITNGMTTMLISDAVVTFFCATLTFTLFYWLLIRQIRSIELQQVNDLTMLFAIVVSILVSTVFDLAVKDLGSYQTPTRIHLLFSVVHLIMCAFILMAEFQIVYNGRLQSNLSTMERAMAEQERQFELSRSTIDAINRRCHDIRHQVAASLADASADGVITRDELAQVVRDIDVYESSLRTGNAALDVVLTEKGLLARQEGITLGVVADGHALDFLPAADTYALFGAALDGAIAAVRCVSDTERHSISLNVRQRMGMAAVSLEHYLPDPNARTDEGHAAGELVLKTLQEVVERHDGTISYADDGSDVLHIDLLIPQA